MTRRLSSFFLHVFCVAFVAAWIGSDIVPEWLEQNRWWLVTTAVLLAVIFYLMVNR